MREAQDQVNACKSRESNHNAQKRQLRLAYQHAQDAVDRIDGELSDATPDAAAIEVLEEALAKAQEELERSEGVLEDIMTQIALLNEECKRKKEELTSAQAVVQDLEFNLNKAQGTVRKLQGQREDELKNKNSAIARVTAAEDNRLIWVKQVETLQVQVEEAIEGTRKICPDRVEVPRGKTSLELEARWKKLIATREDQERQLGGSQDELLRQANEAKRIHKDAVQELEDIKNLRTVSDCNQMVESHH